MIALRIAGTRVTLNPWVPVALAGAYALGLGPEAALVALALATHELAHIVVAAAYELDVDEVEILPFGGRARVVGLELADPGVEAMVALAGPLNNLILYAASVELGPRLPLDPHLLRVFAGANLSLALFNLVPGLPLDGGRVLKALLEPTRGASAAAAAAVKVGRAAAVAMCGAGVALAGFGLAVPGVFVLAYLVWTRAVPERWEAAMAEQRRRLRRGDALRRHGVLPVRTLAAHPDVTLGQLARRLAPRRVHVIVVAGPDLEVLGVVDEHALLEGLRTLGPRATVAELIRR